MDNKVMFTTDDNETVEFHVLEQTQLNGNTYLLVTDADDNEEEGNAYILKDVSADTDDSAVYDVVEDEKELEVIAKIFEELLDDIQIDTE
jgi:hypothetical protein